MPHTIWKGSISFGLVNIPVGLHSAEKRKDLSFTLLDSKNLAPVGYRRVNKKSGKEVPWGDIVKGYEYEDSRYVVLRADDFKRANVKASQTIDIVSFVDAAEIPSVFFDKPYYLEPVGNGRKSYALLREALKRTGKVGVATVVIHTRQYLAVVVPLAKALVLNLLRFPDELRSIDELDLPEESLTEQGVGEKELNMAEMLVGTMVDRWEPDRFHDKYREDLMNLIQHRIETGQIESVEEPMPEVPQPTGAEVIDLMALLKQSIEKSEELRKKTGT